MYNNFRKPKTTLQNSWLNSVAVDGTVTGGGKGVAKTKPLTIAAATSTTKLRKTTKAIITFIAAYFEDSNIHGLQYVVKGGLTTIENCLWLTLLIISMYFCAEIGLQSVDRYYTKSTVVGLERDFHYWNTTMPSVTICPLIRLDIKLFNEYCRLHNLNSDKERHEFFEFMEKLANSTYINFQNIPNNQTIDLILDRLNITPDKYMELIYNLTGDTSIKYRNDLDDVADKIRSTTGDFIIETRQILTEYGLCYMTNTMLSEKFTSLYLIWGEYPVNEIRDLKTTLQVKQSSYFDSDVSYNFLGFNDRPIDGFLHSSYEIMQVDHNLGYTNESLQVDVDCIEIITEEGFESGASVEQRKCRFQHESNLTHYPVYTRNLCLQECRLNLVYKTCKCIPHFYPNRIPKPKPICNYKILRECFVQNAHFFIKLYKVDSDGNKQMVPCQCAQNCQDAIQLQKTNALVGGNSLLFAIINLPTYRLKRLIIFSFTDLMVSIGGTAGLFLGFSVLCLVEVIYYFTLRLLFYLIKLWCRND
ncbi:Sodium channel protein Nach [Lucilia cuprina]|nr:Sodium channel protein Nach [Lucilia cuprina]